jgi:hypothetical protein
MKREPRPLPVPRLGTHRARDGVIARGSRAAIAALWIVASGCSAMRELPRAEWAAAPERKDVEIETSSGERYVFETARFSADSLTGYRQRPGDGVFEQVDATALPLERVTRLQARRIDWYRTGLIGGVVLAGILAASLSQLGGGDGSTDGGPCGPRPCPD